MSTATRLIVRTLIQLAVGLLAGIPVGTVVFNLDPAQTAALVSGITLFLTTIQNLLESKGVSIPITPDPPGGVVAPADNPPVEQP